MPRKSQSGSAGRTAATCRLKSPSTIPRLTPVRGRSTSNWPLCRIRRCSTPNVSRTRGTCRICFWRNSRDGLRVPSPTRRPVQSLDMTSCRALLSVALLACCAAACRGSSSPAPSRSSSTPVAASDWFVDRAAAAGLDFVHFNGMSGAQYYAEHMGPGVALFDYDNDGDLDVFIPQGRMLGAGKKLEQALFPPRGPLPVKGRLFRNDLQVNADGTRTLRFTDVTESSGLDASVYGMGVAAGDYNNDGCVDLYVTALGRNQMFRNNCNGTFSDVSKETRTD